MGNSPFHHFSESEDPSVRFDEVYDVTRTAQVVQGNRTFRLEILRSFTNPNAGPYGARVYRKEKIQGMIFSGGKPVVWQQVWVPQDDFPAVHEATEEAALQAGLCWLRERADGWQ